MNFDLSAGEARITLGALAQIEQGGGGRYNGENGDVEGKRREITARV